MKPLFSLIIKFFLQGNTFDIEAYNILKSSYIAFCLSIKSIHYKKNKQAVFTTHIMHLIGKNF